MTEQLTKGTIVTTAYGDTAEIIDGGGNCYRVYLNNGSMINYLHITKIIRVGK